MNYKEIVGRLTGFSIPVFGVSWNPAQPEALVARRVVAFLEDRRVLYNPYHLEIADQCIASVLEVRRYLTHEIGDLSKQSTLAQHLRGIRAACRKFLDNIGDTGAGRARGVVPIKPSFFTALGELRAAIGVRVAAIAVMHGLDIEGSLADFLPATED